MATVQDTAPSQLVVVVEGHRTDDGTLVMRTTLPEVWVTRSSRGQARILTPAEATAHAATFQSDWVDEEATISTGGIPANLVDREVR